MTAKINQPKKYQPGENTPKKFWVVSVDGDEQIFTGERNTIESLETVKIVSGPYRTKTQAQKSR